MPESPRSDQLQATSLQLFLNYLRRYPFHRRAPDYHQQVDLPQCHRQSRPRSYRHFHKTLPCLISAFAWDYPAFSILLVLSNHLLIYFKLASKTDSS